MVSREAAVAAAAAHFDSGAFVRDLARRVAIRTESQNPASGPELRRYLSDEIAPNDRPSRASLARAFQWSGAPCRGGTQAPSDRGPR